MASYLGAPQTSEATPEGLQVTATAFVVPFCIVGLALWGLPFYYDFMVQQFGWTRAQVTSGNALSKLVIGPAFGDRTWRRGGAVDFAHACAVFWVASGAQNSGAADRGRDYSRGFLVLIGMALLGAAATAALPKRGSAE